MILFSIATNCTDNNHFINSMDHFKPLFAQVLSQPKCIHVDSKKVCNRGVACSLLKLGSLEKT